MGLGLFKDGSGVSAVRFLLSQGAKITVTDLKTKEQLKDQIKRLGKLAAKITWILGEHREADFRSAEMIIKNPGVPKNSKYLKIARDNHVPVETDISLFFQLCDRKRIIGITGTRGKSTSSTLIYELLKTKSNIAVLGGNITKSPLAQMAQVRRGGPVVLELSSWMLESLAELKKSPHLSLFTNIYPDHLNTYDSLADYIEAKKNIFAWQNLQDYVVLNRDNAYTRAMGRKVSAQRHWFSLKEFKEENGCFVRKGKIVCRLNGVEQNICSAGDLALPGKHNLANVLGAVCVAMIYGVKPAVIKSVVKKFKGIPNRLELLRTLGGIKYFNDTTSTMPEATIAALQALGQNRNIVLIAGGSDKGLDFKVLAREIKKFCKAVVLLKGTGTDRMNYELRIMNYGGDVTIANSMPDAVGVAKASAKRGDIILLSPACASFGMFINEFDRGEQFRKIVNEIKL